MHASGLLLSSLAAVLVLFVPGHALLSILPQRDAEAAPPSRDWAVYLADCAALSVALTALVGLWLFIPGIRLNGWAVGVLYALVLLLAAFMVLRRGLRLPQDRAGWLSVLGGLAALALFFAMVAYRLFQARGLALPSWVDSVHHTLIVRVMLEYGGVPDNMAPYLPVPFHYHYGFHLITAAFAFFSRLSPSDAVLWFGQLVNAAIALSVYRLAAALVGSGIKSDLWDEKTLRVLRGGVAALLVGFAFHMPGYYLTWGRYTLAVGLVLAGPALAAAYELWRNPKDLPAGVRFAVLFAGLFLVHYLVVVLVGLFLLVLGLAGLRFAVIKRDPLLLPWSLVAACLVGFAASFPWVLRVMEYNAHEVGVDVVLPSVTSFSGLFAAGQWGYLFYLMGPGHNHILLGMSAVGLLLALRRPGLRLVAGWGLLTLLLSLPWGVKLGPFRPDLYNIVLFFPASILLADLLVSAGGVVGRVIRRPGAQMAVSGLVLALVVAGLVAWGVRSTRDILNPSTVFVTPGDVMALDWVKEHTPPTARFFINSVPWQNSMFRGVDGGYWLLPYTGRASLVPPAMYAWIDQKSFLQILNWAQRSNGVKPCTPEFAELVGEAGLTHVYLRQGQGSLQPQDAETCSQLKQVYSSAGIFIYEIIQP